MPKNNNSSRAIEKYQKTVKQLRLITSISLVLGIIAIFISIYSIYVVTPGFYSLLSSHVTTAANNTTAQTSKFPTFAGIDDPLNSTQLSVINNAPNSYFETAGLMYLNGSISNPIFTKTNAVTSFTYNNKTSVVYLGSITCIFCGENRWAMALALSRFGNFSKLFIGYSSLNDGDVPTLYWTSLDYNTSTTTIGNYYSSRYINFFSIDDVKPITGGFNLNTMPQMLSNIKARGNQTYVNAFDYIINLSSRNATAFTGTPYTIWGNYQFEGADAADFGNSTPTGGTVALSYMTHAQVFSQLAHPSDQFAWTEYAAADVYTAAICKSIGNSASVCSLPSIQEIETAFK